jgi:hypothetical protein
MSSKKFYQSKKFIELQNKWYDKLTDSGFSDIEYLDQKTGQGQSTPYLESSLNHFRHLRASDISNMLEYFTLASQFLNDHKFPTKLHKFMWGLYCENISYRKMIPIIKARGFKFVPSIYWISIKINELKSIFKQYQLAQPSEDESLEDFIASNRS